MGPNMYLLNHKNLTILSQQNDAFKQGSRMTQKPRWTSFLCHYCKLDLIDRKKNYKPLK